jgi:hypothetical protein
MFERPLIVQETDPSRSFGLRDHAGRQSRRVAEGYISIQRGERANSRKCALHALLISSASYAECALYLARANDGQTAGPSHWRNSFTNDCSGSEMLRGLD